MSYSTLADEIDAAARIVIEHGALQDEPLAFAALRRNGYQSRFIGAAWQQIVDRAAELSADDSRTVH